MLSKIKEIVSTFADVHITFNSKKEIEFFDPTNPKRKIIGEEKGNSINLFEINETEEISSLQEKQSIIDCQLIASEQKNLPLKDLALLVL